MNLQRWFATVSIAVGLGASALGPSAFAREIGAPAAKVDNEIPTKLEGVGITEKLGEKVNLDLPFKDESGAAVSLRKYTSTGKPVLLSLAYYSCPSLCNFHLNGLLDAFKGIKKPIGDEFQVVVVSIEPKETPALAAAKKASYIEAYGRPEGADGWHFLTGSESSIREITKQVGFGYAWDEEQKQWSHAAAAMVLTPEGVVSRYLYGIVFQPQTVRLSMIEASSGKIGTIVDRLVLFCFHYDPKASKYTLMAFNVMRGGAVLAVVVMTAFLAPFWFRSRREEQRLRASGPARNELGQGEA